MFSLFRFYVPSKSPHTVQNPLKLPSLQNTLTFYHPKTLHPRRPLCAGLSSKTSSDHHLARFSTIERFRNTKAVKCLCSRLVVVWRKFIHVMPSEAAEKTRYLVRTAGSRVRFLKGFPSMKSSTSGSPLSESSEFSMKIC